MNPTIETIISRRSVRHFLEKKIPDNLIDEIMEAGRWAPSGLNNQPWKFMVIRSIEYRTRLAQMTSYGRIIMNCDACLAVFYDHSSGYNREKDLMSIGACIQNMLLAATSMGIGSIWLGEIVNKKEEVLHVFNFSDDTEFVALIALGYAGESPRIDRRDLSAVVIGRI